MRMIMQVVASLNPCFNGRYSRSANPTATNKEVCEVLILVLMEDTLGEL